jgi:ribosomal protein S21
MALEIKKQERETTQSLVRRFGRRIQQSGILLRARNGRFRKRPKSRQAQKRAALRREELKKEYKKLKKLGKPKDTYGFKGKDSRRTK